MKRAIALVGAVVVWSGGMAVGIAQEPEVDETVPDGDRAGSESPLMSVRQALDVVNRLENPVEQVDLSLEIARLFARSGRGDDAALVLAQAVIFANDVDRAMSRVGLLVRIADALAATGASEEAIALLELAEETAAEVDADLDRAALLSDVAAQYADWLQPGRAMSVLMQAAEAAIAADPSERQAALLATLALQYADLGQVEQAADLVARSESVLVALQGDDADDEDDEDAPLTAAPWDGSVGLLSSIFSGDRLQGVVTLSADADRRWSRNSLDLGLRLNYNFDRDRDDVNEFGGQFTTDAVHYFTNDLQYFVNSSVTSSDLEDLNLRAQLVNGLGVNLWQASAERRLDLRLGVGLRYESFQDEASSFNPVTGSVGLSYRDVWFDTLELTQTLSVDVPVDNAADYLFQSRTDLGIPISDRWSFNNSARVTLNGEPASDNSGVLFNLQTGLRYQF